MARLSAFTNKPYGIYAIAVSKNDNAFGTEFFNEAWRSSFTHLRPEALAPDPGDIGRVGQPNDDDGRVGDAVARRESVDEVPAMQKKRDQEDERVAVEVEGFHPPSVGEASITTLRIAAAKGWAITIPALVARISPVPLPRHGAAAQRVAVEDGRWVDGHVLHRSEHARHKGPRPGGEAEVFGEPERRVPDHRLDQQDLERHAAHHHDSPQVVHVATRDIDPHILEDRRRDDEAENLENPGSPVLLSGRVDERREEKDQAEDVGEQPADRHS